MGARGQFPLPARPLVLAAGPGRGRAGAAPGCCELAERIGRPAVLIPTDDAGAIFLAEHGDELRQWFLFPDPPADLPRQVAGKYSLYQLCRELGVPCPAAALTGVAAGSPRASPTGRGSR